MKESKANLILHPVRMRIIQTLVGGRNMTVQQMSELLPDIPQATMYRHLNMLLKAGILIIVEQKQIRGAVEKVYALAEMGGSLTGEDLQNASKEDHMQYFLHFVASLIGDFGLYLEQDTIDLEADGVGYRQATFYLSDEEFMTFIQSVGNTFAKALKNEPAPGRRRRTISTIVIPEPLDAEE